MEVAMRNTILRILIGTIFFSLISGVVVSIIGLVLGWKTATQFSNGFFWAGTVMISIGFISFQGYGQHNANWPPAHLNPTDRAKLWRQMLFVVRCSWPSLGFLACCCSACPSWCRNCSSPHGTIAGTVRKSSPASLEAFFYHPGDGSHVIEMEIGCLGVGVCYGNPLFERLYGLFQASVDLVLQSAAGWK
jgi:hypothetical protein